MKQNAVRIAQKLARRKRRIQKRLQVAQETRFVRMTSGAPPVLNSAGLKYELADKTQAIVYGGVPLRASAHPWVGAGFGETHASGCDCEK